MKDKFYYSSEVKELSRSQMRDLANFIIIECIERIGRKKNLSVPKVQIRKGIKNMGYYDSLNNYIRVHHNLHTNVGEFVRTLVHEYTHYTQPIKTQYNKLYKKYGYLDHPFEVEARKNEVDYGTILLTKYRKQL